MPSLSAYKKNLQSYGKNNSEARKSQSDMVIENTWWEPIGAYTAYIYDFYHDSQPLVLDNLDPVHDNKKTPIDIHFIRNRSQSYGEDSVAYHLQLRPSQECSLSYYNECFEKRYDQHWPCGLYIDIPDSKGRYNRWLIVQEANSNDPQIPTYEILRCDYVFQWIYKGKKYQCAGVRRSQNSYNSGQNHLPPTVVIRIG